MELDEEERRLLDEVARCFAEEGRWEEAAAIWRGLAELEPGDARPLLALAAAEIARGAPDVALAWIDRRGPGADEAIAGLLRAAALLDLGRYAEAGNALHRAVADRGRPELAAVVAELRRRCAGVGPTRSHYPLIAFQP